MRACDRACPHECKPRHPISPGTVDDVETICRGASEPMHYNKGKIKNSVIKNSDLLTGALSVWRVSERSGATMQEVVQQIQSSVPQPNQLKELLGAAAGAIRAIGTGAGAPRALCILDDCAINAKGDAHPAHAHIALCERLTRSGISKDHEEFQSIKRDLLTLWKKSPRVWPK